MTPDPEPFLYRTLPFASSVPMASTLTVAADAAMRVREACLVQLGTARKPVGHVKLGLRESVTFVRESWLQ